MYEGGLLNASFSNQETKCGVTKGITNYRYIFTRNIN